MPTMAMRKDLVVFSFLVSLLHSIQNVSASVNLISVQEHTFRTWYAFINTYLIYTHGMKEYTSSANQCPIVFMLLSFQWISNLIYHSKLKCQIFASLKVLPACYHFVICQQKYTWRLNKVCRNRQLIFLYIQGLNNMYQFWDTLMIMAEDIAKVVYRTNMLWC